MTLETDGVAQDLEEEIIVDTSAFAKNVRRDRKDLLLPGQTKTNSLSPTSRAPVVRGLRDETFIAPPGESAKHSG